MLRTRTSTSLAALLCLAFASGARAQANDDWANRTQIAALPFHVKETQIYSATHDPTDPAPPCGGAGNTLWYGFTTGGSPAYLSLALSPVADVEGAILGTVAVYSGTPGAFKLVNGACASDTGNPVQNKAQLYGVRLEPNTAYSIEVGNNMNFGPGQRVDLTVSVSPTYTVTKTVDTADGVCNGDCSLREAIGAANAVPGAVVVPAGTYTLSIANNPDATEDANASGDLDVTSGMGIYGAGMNATTIDANHVDRVLDVFGTQLDPRAVAIGDLTLANGTPLLALDKDQRGGGLRTQPPIGTTSPLFVGVERVKLIGNTATFAGGGASFQTQGMLRDCRFTGNATSDGGGGLRANPGQGQILDVIGCTFDGNTADSPPGPLTAYQYGGGINASSFGTVRIVNSTISGNHARLGGAGIHAGSFPIVLRSNTIVSNDNLSASAFDRGAGVYLNGTFNGTNQVSNNVIAGNTSAAGDAADCSQDGGSTMSSDHNHVQNNNSCTFGGTGDVLTGDPLVNALADNGGPTPTHALGPLSPAVDGGDPAGCKGAENLVLACDQRGAGYPRRQGDACDKGAFELKGDKVFRDGFEATDAVGVGCPDAPSS